MKRISPATVTFGVMAIVLGLVAAYIVRQSMEKPPVVQAPPKPAPEPQGGDPVTGAVRAATRVAETGLKVAGGVTREVLRRLPRP